MSNFSKTNLLITKSEKDISSSTENITLYVHNSKLEFMHHFIII